MYSSLTEKKQQGIVFRRSLFVVKKNEGGDLFTSENVRSIRFGQGLHPRFLDIVLGRRATRDIKRGIPLAIGDIG